MERVATILPEIQEYLEKATRILVITHVGPDGDAIGTQLAFGHYLTDMGKEVFLVRDARTPEKYLFLPGVESIVLTSTLSHDLAIDTALVLECPSLERAGSARCFLSDNIKIVNIDHHRDSTTLGQVNWIDQTASSVGEMAFEYFQHVGYNLSAEVATCLYTAILTDTGRFRYESTSPRTMQIAGELIARGANPRIMFVLTSSV